MSSLGETNKWERVVWPVLAFALLLGLWHYLVIWSGTKVFPSPMQVEKGIVELLHKNVLWPDIANSLRRVAIGFGSAVVVGIPLGLWLGWYPPRIRL
jgi:NitT/TauT family transport system permease protein